MPNKHSSESGINPVNSDSHKNDVYFTNENFSKEIKNNKNVNSSKEKNNKKHNKNQSVKSTYLFFIVVIIVSITLSVYAIFCLNDIFGMTKSKSMVTVSYSENIDSMAKAIDLLHDNDLIECKYFCTFYGWLTSHVISSSDIVGPYNAGVYYLNGKMGLENMLVTMKGEPKHRETVSLTFPEGITTAEIVNKLVVNEVCDRASLLAVIQSTEFSYSLVSELKSSEEIPYRLEGYLFPDTYDFYIGQSASSVLDVFLKNLESKVTMEDRKRAEELGFTIDEILTIASIVQAEAGTNEQMKSIASVIENRLRDKTNYPSLGCQSTTDYIKNKVAPSLSNMSAHTSEYYLQYYSTNSDSTVVGLPEGPICNPGRKAIEAALYPEESNNYFFFHDTKGKLYTAKTYSEFKSKIQKYAPYLSY